MESKSVSHNRSSLRLPRVVSRAIVKHGTGQHIIFDMCTLCECVGEVKERGKRVREIGREKERGRSSDREREEISIDTVGL
jgi:hypothetical protein